MPRQPSTIRPTKLHLCLPEDIRGTLDIHLYSPSEARVPVGAYQSFFIERIREFFAHRRLPLEPFGFPPGFFVSGPADMIQALSNRLKGGTE